MKENYAAGSVLKLEAPAFKCSTFVHFILTSSIINCEFYRRVDTIFVLKIAVNCYHVTIIDALQCIKVYRTILFVIETLLYFFFFRQFIEL